jgi:hypothetical protein
MDKIKIGDYKYIVSIIENVNGEQEEREVGESSSIGGVEKIIQKNGIRRKYVIQLKENKQTVRLNLDPKIKSYISIPTYEIIKNLQLTNEL